MRFLLPFGVLVIYLSMTSAQTTAPQTALDSDHDGLSDVLENALLTQFAPQFMASSDDCSVRPAEFVPMVAQPTVKEDNGTIYGQVFPRTGHADQVELHYYHLWRKDCGEKGHNLDWEHVSVLLNHDDDLQWKALYWYAAAHEDTVCDASQIARAATLNAESHGPQVWISRGKHASFLSEVFCVHGCGGDDCRALTPLASPKIINLGEVAVPMNGAVWTGSPEWTLAVKMDRSDFPDALVARVDQLAVARIAWANPERQPFQSVVRNGNSALGAVATSGRATDTALDLADNRTGKALAGASGSTRNGISMALHAAGKALSVTARKVGDSLGAK